jgi:hypothetical protein
MALLPSPDYFGYTLFCDDIRQEADGKFFFIGVYGADMFIHMPFPVTLPKFAFAITLVQQKEIMTPNVGFHIFLPGDTEEPSIQGGMTEKVEGAIGAELDARRSLIHPAALAGKEEELVAVHANLILTSLVIKEPGRIKVRGICGENIVRLGGLRISPGQVQEQPQS